MENTVLLFFPIDATGGRDKRVRGVREKEQTDIIIDTNLYYDVLKKLVLCEILVLLITQTTFKK